MSGIAISVPQNAHLQQNNQQRPSMLSSSPRQRSHTTGAVSMGTTAATTATSLASATRELMVDAANPIDFNYAYMLMYVNCNNIRVQSLTHTSTSSKLVVATSFSNSAFDHVRTMFVLRLIEQLLLECDREFLGATISTTITANPSLATTGTTRSRSPVFSVHNEKFLDLISRHLRTIYGSSFYTQSSGQTSANNTNSGNGSPHSQHNNSSPPLAAFSALNLNSITYMEVCFHLLYLIKTIF